MERLVLILYGRGKYPHVSPQIPHLADSDTSNVDKVQRLVHWVWSSGRSGAEGKYKTSQRIEHNKSTQQIR